MTDWTTVHAGPYPQALTVQALLEAAGIPTRVPDTYTKLVDPFVTGADPLGARVEVPSDRADEACALLDEARAEAAARDDPGDVELEARAVDRLGMRVRWCLVMPVLGWLGAVALGRRYEREARALPALPNDFASVLVARRAALGLLLGIPLLGVLGLLARLA